MTFTLQNHKDEYISVDFNLNISTGWENTPRKTLIGATSIGNCWSWNASAMSPTERMYHFLSDTPYKLLSIDFIPIDNWKRLHPEYFI